MLRVLGVAFVVGALFAAVTGSAGAAAPKLCSVNGQVWYAPTGVCGANPQIPNGATVYKATSGYVYTSGGFRRQPLTVAGNGSLSFCYRMTRTSTGAVGGHIRIAAGCRDEEVRASY